MNKNSHTSITATIGSHQGSRSAYQHPPPPRPSPPPLPPPGMLPRVQAFNMDSHVHQPSTSARISRTSTAHPFNNNAEPRPIFALPAPPPPPLSIMANEARHLRALSDTRTLTGQIAMFMSMQDLFAQGAHIVNPDPGLPNNFNSDHLNTRTFASCRHHSEDLTRADEKPNFCVICQMEFKDQEMIGMLDCCHEYHAQCIKKWLTVKNNCPVCKSTALHKTYGK